MKKIFITLLLLLISLVLFSCDTESECKHENMIENVSEPTCTECGYTEKSCRDCDYKYISDYTDAKGHSYSEVTTPPTCIEAGYTTYTCACGEAFTSMRTDALGHDYSLAVTEPTCTEGGYTKYTCNICAKTYISDHTDLIGHSLTESITSPTCTSQGYTTYTCACGYSYDSNYLSPLEHTFLQENVAATCTTQGYTTYNCACGYTFTSDLIAPVGHTFISAVTAPTCTNEGYTTYTCACSYSYVSNKTAPTGHSYTPSTVKEATCTESGETVYTCACQHAYSISLDPIGHDFSETVTMPTLSDMGNTVFTCSECEYSYQGNYTFYSDILEDAYSNSTEPLAKGIDVSYHNYKLNGDGEYISLDWNAIKNAGISYVIIRVGDAAIGIDPTFEKTYAEAKAAGLDVGVYFYTRATSTSEIELEANLVLAALEGKKFEYPIYLDLEDDSLISIDPSILNEMCMRFFTTLQRAGYYTGLYVNDEWLYKVIDTETALSRFEIWYARYPSYADGEITAWSTETFGQPLGMWQYTDKGTVIGIDETVFDFNYSYKDYPSIIEQHGFNGYESDFLFPDTNKSFVWVIFEGSIKIRSKYDYYMTEDYDPSLDVIGYAQRGARFEVIETNEYYTAIKYNGETAYVSSKDTYVSFEGLYIK